MSCSQHLYPVNQPFLASFDHNIDAMNIGNIWIKYLDLYKFPHLTVMLSFIETIYESGLVDLNRLFVGDL
ncbi:hypothetical protein F4779DRAFT_611504 [Xylariaceae sp. FL0662B]|nr:hypothetical protein F4779DRAFT_611504 [Xylariaceae sp. FL0662B]